MALRLPDQWVWDFWLARAQDEHHVFYLQAPRTLGDPLLRHHHASIGHAVSADLRRWRVVRDAIRPGRSGSWDDLAVWTGSVIERDGRWQMLYTGINRSERGLIQRIGLATSDDLVHWRKHPGNPVIEADGRWYELLDLDRWKDQSWRDPWLFALDGEARVLLSARSRAGPADGAGVVGQARSSNFVDWEVLPPLTAPGEFAQVECPQLVSVDGRRLILFSCLAEDHSTARRERTTRVGVTGTFFFEPVGRDGEYLPSDDPIAGSDSALGPLYAGKLVEAAPDEWRFLAFRGAGDRDFVGELIDPLPVRLTPGTLRVVVEPETTAVC
jgi:beta-fructofuranosidase